MEPCGTPEISDWKVLKILSILTFAFLFWRADWLREETNELKPFWYECSQLPTSMKGKRKSQAKGKEVDLVKQSKAIDERPQQLSAVAAKIQMDHIPWDKEELEESDNNDDDFASESDSLGSDFYQRQIVPMVYLYLVNTFINHYPLNFAFLSFPYVVVWHFCFTSLWSHNFVNTLFLFFTNFKIVQSKTSK